MEILTRAKKGTPLTHTEVDTNMLILDRREITAGEVPANTDVKILTIPISSSLLMDKIDDGEVIKCEISMGAEFFNGSAEVIGVFQLTIEYIEGGSYLAIASSGSTRNTGISLGVKDDKNHIHITASIDVGYECEFLSRAMWYFSDEKEDTAYNF